MVNSITAQHLVETILKMEMATCFAYGQTGSEKKTYHGWRFIWEEKLKEGINA